MGSPSESLSTPWESQQQHEESVPFRQQGQRHLNLVPDPEPTESPSDRATRHLQFIKDVLARKAKEAQEGEAEKNEVLDYETAEVGPFGSQLVRNNITRIIQDQKAPINPTPTIASPAFQPATVDSWDNFDEPEMPARAYALEMSIEDAETDLLDYARNLDARREEIAKEAKGNPDMIIEFPFTLNFNQEGHPHVSIAPDAFADSLMMQRFSSNPTAKKLLAKIRATSPQAIATYNLEAQVRNFIGHNTLQVDTYTSQMLGAVARTHERLASGKTDMPGGSVFATWFNRLIGRKAKAAEPATVLAEKDGTALAEETRPTSEAAPKSPSMLGKAWGGIKSFFGRKE